MNPFHKYELVVIEFFSSILYLGGERTFNMLRGPMTIDSKKTTSSANIHNIGGPGIETIRKRNAAYATAPGVLKYSLLLLNNLIRHPNYESVKPLFKTELFEVYSVTFSNDGTALKSSIQFDENMNVNIGLQDKILDYNFCKENQFIEKETLVNEIICEAVVTSVATINNALSLPVAVTYSSKKGQSADKDRQVFTDEVKVLQMCSACQKTKI